MYLQLYAVSVSASAYVCASVSVSASVSASVYLYLQLTPTLVDHAACWNTLKNCPCCWWEVALARVVVRVVAAVAVVAAFNFVFPLLCFWYFMPVADMFHWWAQTKHFTYALLVLHSSLLRVISCDSKIKIIIELQLVGWWGVYLMKLQFTYRNANLKSLLYTVYISSCICLSICAPNSLSFASLACPDLWGRDMTNK